MVSCVAIGVTQGEAATLAGSTELSSGDTLDERASTTSPSSTTPTTFPTLMIALNLISSMLIGHG